MCSNNALICGRSWALHATECGIGLHLEIEYDVFPLFIKTLFGPSYDLLTRSSSSSPPSSSSSSSSSPLPPVLFRHFRSGTTCRTALPSVAFIIFAHLLPLTSPTRSPFPHSSTRQPSPFFFPVVRLDRLSWRSIKSLQLLSPPPAPHHRFPSVKRPQVHHPPLSPAVPL
jgi:hypothetical protein